MLKSVKPGAKRGKPKERMKGIKQFGQLWPQIQVAGLEKADRSISEGEKTDEIDQTLGSGHNTVSLSYQLRLLILTPLWHPAETSQTLSELLVKPQIHPPGLMITFVVFGLWGFENCNVAMSSKSNENIQKMTTKA